VTEQEQDTLWALACIAAQMLHYFPDAADEHLSLCGVQHRIDEAIDLLVQSSGEPRDQVKAAVYHFLDDEDL
jgi:hypothetical protein